MAFPASQFIPAEQLPLARIAANKLKARLQEINATSLAGPLPRHRLIALLGGLDRAISIFNTASATPGIAQYARDQFNDQSLDIVAEYAVLVTEVGALRDWVFSNFPKDAGSGAWLTASFPNTGVSVELNFTTGQLAGYRFRADLVIAAIG